MPPFENLKRKRKRARYTLTIGHVKDKIIEMLYVQIRFIYLLDNSRKTIFCHGLPLSGAALHVGAMAMRPYQWEVGARDHGAA